jgi:hypothetical protein
MPESNPSEQRCLSRFFAGDFNFKGFTARRLYKSFGVKGLTWHCDGAAKIHLCICGLEGEKLNLLNPTGYVMHHQH